MPDLIRRPTADDAARDAKPRDGDALKQAADAVAYVAPRTERAPPAPRGLECRQGFPFQVEALNPAFVGEAFLVVIRLDFAANGVSVPLQPDTIRVSEDDQIRTNPSTSGDGLFG